MAANRTPAGPRSRRWWLAFPSFLGCVALLVGFCWWVTPPLEPIPSEGDSPSLTRTGGGRADRGPEPGPSDPPESDDLPDWPEDRLEGREAKWYLLKFMEQAVRQLDRAEGYTAELKRQERIDGTLGPEQSLRIKVQHDPFAVYLFFESPKPGREVLYHEGRFENQLLAHNGDWTRRFIPRLRVDPYGAIALADNRHPITEAGLAHLSRQLLHFRKLDLDDPVAETVLDRSVDEQGKLWYCSTHIHREYSDDRPFAYVEIKYCPDLLIPLRIASYDWPEPGCEEDEFRLAERYHYENVEFDVSFTAIDFDPTNPDYGFQRY